MSDFKTDWISASALPKAPLQMLLPGHSNEVHKAQLPVVRWGQALACVLDDGQHHDQAWLVVFGDGKHLTGARALHETRQVEHMELIPNAQTLRLTDHHGRQRTFELDELVKLAGHLDHNYLPIGIPVNLYNGHDYLMADQDGISVAVNPDPKAMQWVYQDGHLTNVSTRQVLGLGLRCKPHPQADDVWRMNEAGQLFYGQNERQLVSDPYSGDVSLQKHEGEVLSSWSVKFPGVRRRSQAAIMVVNKLNLVLRVSNDYKSGTSDSVSFSLNGSGHRQKLAADFERGTVHEVEVDLLSMFDNPVVYVDELSSIEFYQSSAGGYGPAWKMQSLDIVVNDTFSNRVLGSDNRWIEPGEAVVWQGRVNWLDWRSSAANTPLDFAGYTYPVQWQQWAIDFLNWRSYRPETIEGVCQLIGEDSGRLLAYEFKNNRMVSLKANSDSDSYTWVFTPQSSIIFKHWDHSTDRSSYTRHSQLGGGNPVVCAGELRIDRKSTSTVVRDIFGMVNDASGHYKPDGGKCLISVLERLEQLGLSTSETLVSFRS